MERIQRLDLLEGHFQRLLAPPKVASEVGELPSWVEVEKPSKSPDLDALPSHIHPGEAEVILLGLEKPGAVLLLDDWYAREFARQSGLITLGTVGLLLRSKQTGKLKSVSELLDQLEGAGFRLSQAVAAEAKRLANED